MLLSAPLTLRLVLALSVPPFMWAANAVAGRLLAGEVPPFALNALRWLLAILILLPLGWQAVASPSARAEIWLRRKPLAVLGLLGVGAYNALQYWALETSSALNVTLIAASLPVWMLLLGVAVFNVRPSRRELLGAVVSLCGVVVVVARGDLSQLSRLKLAAGDGVMLVAVLGWAVYSWLLARPHRLLAPGARPDWNWAGFLLVQALFGMVWAGGGAIGEMLVGGASIRWSPAVILGLAFVAIGPSVIAYRMWGLAVPQAGPALAGLFANLTPLFAAVMGAAILGEAPQPYHGLSFALIAAGIAVSVKR